MLYSQYQALMHFDLKDEATTALQAKKGTPSAHACEVLAFATRGTCVGVVHLPVARELRLPCRQMRAASPHTPMNCCH